MAVYRVHKTKNFTTINNYLIKDENLTLKDKGMMLVLLSLPDNWNFSVKGLETICKEARNTINSILNDLEFNEYLERNKIYENGKIKEWRYDIYEIPKYLYRKNEDIENVDIENEDIENDTQLNTKELNTKKINTKQYNTTTLIDYLQDNGFNLTPIQLDVVKEWEDNDLTRHAIKQAVLNNKFNIKYIDKILYNYQKENITTIQQAIEREEQFNNKNKKKVSNVPSWFNEEFKEEELDDETRKLIEEIEGSSTNNS